MALFPTGGDDPSGTGWLYRQGNAIPFGGDDPSGPGYLLLGTPPPNIRVSSPDRDWKGNLIYRTPTFLQDTTANYNAPVFRSPDQPPPEQTHAWTPQAKKNFAAAAAYLAPLTFEPFAKISAVTFEKERDWFWSAWKCHLRFSAVVAIPSGRYQSFLGFYKPTEKSELGDLGPVVKFVFSEHVLSPTQLVMQHTIEIPQLKKDKYLCVLAIVYGAQAIGGSFHAYDSPG